jgi:elongation factor Ts
MLEDERVELVAKLGENIIVQGAERYEASNGEVVADYVHPPAGKIGVLVLATASPELARMVAMHVAAARPTYVGRDEVPEAEVAAERALYEKLPEVAAKPEDVRPKIVEGMLAKRFFAANVLLDQNWVHDPSLTVGKALAEHGAEVKAFVRYNVGRE